ncbi:unnamed protein product [Rhizophagus irregularis]|nr:unnamed protein product [Rhizophagus irregularis]
MQQKKNKKCFIVNRMILTFLTILTTLINQMSRILQINSNDDEKEKTQKYVDDDDEVYNNPNFHSKEQDELEIPDDGF